MSSQVDVERPSTPERTFMGAVEVALRVLAVVLVLLGLAWTFFAATGTPVWIAGQPVAAAVPHVPVTLEFEASRAHMDGINEPAWAHYNDLLDEGRGGSEVPVVAELYGAATYEASFWNLKPGQSLAWSVTRHAIPHVFWAAGLWIGAGFIRSVRRGDPFVRANVVRLRWLSVLVLVGGAVVDLGQSLVRYWLVTSTEQPELATPPLLSFSLWWVVVAVVLAILADVWSRAARLEREHRTLV